MLKKFLIGTLAVVAFVVTTNLALASYDFGSAILKVGSRGQYVTTLQNLVGATPIDGFFGPKTKAKVVAWQAANGLMADGLFGNLSKTKANETGTNFRAGCTNASGFSTTTGLPCSSLNANTFLAGCTNASGFSTTTGFACTSANANTFPVGCSNASGFSTTTGYSCVTGLPRVISGSRSSGSSHYTTVTAIGAITGTLKVGATLTAGAVTPSDATVSYQWQIGDIAGGVSYPNIEGATSSTYTILAGDVGKYLDVTATGTGNYSGSVKSSPTTVIGAATISAAAIAGVTVPVTGATPVTTVTAGTGYTGTVAWSPSNNPFNVTQVYTATITLTATSGYTLTGVTADQFTIAGATTDTNSANSGVITAVFPATATTRIVATAIAGVTPPVTGATPVTTVTAGTGYTGTVTWSGTPSTFASATSYTATITLTATSGYTLTGVSANQFTIAGATTDTNPINSGVITAVFPATATTLVARTSPAFTTAVANTTITITLTSGTFKTGIVKSDFTFAGTDAIAIAQYGTFTYTSTIIVTITGLGTHLAGGTTNTVTVLGTAQATQAASVAAVAST